MDFIRRLKPGHLRLMAKIAEVGQLQIAAQALAMSQPAASRILAEIERQVETPLFHRTPKGMEVTTVGEAFVRHARVVLSELANLQKELKSLTTGQAGEVRIGTVTGPAVGIVLPVLHELRETSPDIAVTIEVGPSSDLVRGLEEGRFDFIIARIPSGQDSREFKLHPARFEIVHLVVRQSHPLAGRPNVSLKELAEFDWVIQESGSPIRQAVEAKYHEAGIHTPRRVINSSSLLVVEALLATSDVIAPQAKEVGELLTGSDFGAHLTLIQLEEQIVVTPYFVIRQSDRQLPRAAELFFNRLLTRL